METQKSKIAVNKLLILYILECAEYRVSDMRLILACGELALMDYFDLNSALHDLVENHLAEQSDSVNGTFYTISDIGKTTLDFFRKELLYSLRTKIGEYCQKHREDIRLDSQLYTDYMRISDEQYRVNLRLLENDLTVFEVSFFAASKEEADRYCKKWRENALAVYAKTFETLLD